MSKSLTWNERLALLDHFQPTDEVACSALGISQNDLNAARQMRKIGDLVPSTNIDYSSYSSLFTATGTATATTKPTKETLVKVENSQPPQSATKKVKEPQKRGRKGDKISAAFAAIPAEPTNATTFAESHAVSIAVLRQSKRFDKFPELGNVKVAKDRESGDLMIWREASSL